MKCFIIAWKDLKIHFMDRRAWLMMLLLPLLLTVILGSALKNVFADEDTMADTTVGFYADGGDPLGLSFKQDVLQQADFIHVKTASSKSELIRWVKEGKVDAALAIPKEWSRGMEKGKMEQVELIADRDHEFQASVLESITTSYTEKSMIGKHAVQTVMNDLTASSRIDAKSGEETAVRLTETVAASLAQKASVKSRTAGEKDVSSMQYYAAAMAAMFLLYNITNGAKSFLKEEETDTLSRLNMTPSGKGSIILGKFFGIFFFAWMQWLLFTVGTVLLCQVDWGGNWPLLLAAGSSYAAAVGGLAVLAAGLAVRERTLDLISGIGIQLAAILGGSMLPLTEFPAFLKKAADIVPNKWALTGFLDIMGGASWPGLRLMFLVLLLTAAAGLGCGALRLRMRG